MKAKFQPAPWEVGVWTDVVKDYHDHPDGLTRGQFQVFPIPEDIQAEYYRRLFEAAPALLAALRTIVDLPERAEQIARRAIEAAETGQ